MPYLDARVYDAGLNALDTEATHIHLTSAEAATFAAVGSTTLGNSTISIGAPGARTGGGRKVTVAAISAGSVTANGSAGFYAIIDNTNSRLLAAAPLSAAQTVTSGNTFSLPAFDIGIPGPV